MLQGHLPDQQVVLGALRDVCVPVAKDGQSPGPAVLPIARWVDLACYEASADPVDVDVTLSHLNPVLAGLPDEAVKLAELERVCVPVRKNDSVIPAPIRRIVRHMDFACYALEEPTPSADTPLTLTHLNREISELGLEDRLAELKRARRLCVPIGKNQEDIPADVLGLVEWIDFLQYRIVPQTAADAEAFEVPIPLELHHLNPLFAGFEPFDVTLDPARQPLVPVAKDGHLPPQD